MSGGRKHRAWPVGIVVGLGFVVVANAIMIGIALSHPSVPAAEDHWAESLDWDRELAQRERSAALGWSVVEIGASAELPGAVELRVVDREGRALTGLSGTLALERSDSDRFDRELKLVELGEGRYRSAEGVPQSGSFELELALRSPAGERFVTRSRVDLGALPASWEAR